MHAREQIKDYFSRTVKAKIEDDTDIFDMGLVDSLFAIQLVVFVEKELSVRVEREDLHIRNFCSIAALGRFVAEKQAKSGRAGAHNGLAADE